VAYPPEPVSSHLRRRRVRSLKGGRGLSTPLPPISALPRRLPPAGPGCDQLRGEPAITGLDWSFAPRPGSWERIARQHPFGPPPGFRPASPYPGLDRPVSGLIRVTPGPFRPHPSPGTRKQLLAWCAAKLREAPRLKAGCNQAFAASGSTPVAGLSVSLRLRG